MKNKGQVNVVLINGLTGKPEEHKISLKDGHYGDDIRSIMFDEYHKINGKDKYGSHLGMTPSYLVNEITSLFKMKEGYKSIVGFNDDCGMLRNPEWDFSWFTSNEPYGFVSSPFVFLNRRGTKSNGEPLYGDLFFDEYIGW